MGYIKTEYALIAIGTVTAAGMFLIHRLGRVAIKEIESLRKDD
jgi:hypothetical protein